MNNSLLTSLVHPFLRGAIAAALGLLPFSAAIAHDEPVEPAVANRLNALTDQTIAGIGEFHRAAASQKAAAGAKLKWVADERRQLLLRSVERHPGFVLQKSVPNGMTTSLPAEVQSAIEQEAKFTGFVGLAVGDDFRNRSARHRYFLDVDAPNGALRYRLHAPDAPDHAGHEHPAAAFVGQSVTIRALKFDRELLLVEAGAIGGTGSATEGTTNLAAGTVSGTQSTLVLLGNFRDKQLDANCTPSFVNNVVFGPTNSVHDLYRQSSNGLVGFSGVTYGPFQMSTSTSTSDFWAIGDEMDRIATAQGINVRNFSKTLYVVPQTTSNFIGYTVISVGSAGSFYRSWVMACAYTDIYAHELGHLLGFGHSSTPGNEYGDTSDIMGSSTLPLRQFNAPRKVNAGWIPSSRVQSVNGPGTFTLDPTAHTYPVNPQVLLVAKADTGDNYFVSLREAIGYDSGLVSGYLNRVSIHRAPAAADKPTTLLATLGSGDSYNDSTNGIQFSVAGIGSSATVSVNMAAAVCTRAAPSVSVSPVSQSAAAGMAVSYQINVASNNNAGCGTSTYSFTPQLPSGWSSTVTPFTMSLGAGQSSTAVWTVTSPASNLAEQSYPVYLSSYDTAATTSSRTVQGNYIVTVPDSTLPATSVTYPSSGTTVSGNVTISAAATDNRGVAKVEFWVDGKLYGTDTSAPYSISWNTRKLSGTHTISTRAYDAAGNSAASAPVSVTVAPSGGSKRGR